MMPLPPISPPSLPKSDTIKNIGIGVGVLVISVVGYRAYNDYKDKNKNGTDENKKKNIDAIVVDKSKLTKEPIVYQNVAGQVHDTIKRYGMQATPTQMLQFFNGFNDDELKQIYKEFGIRQLNECWICSKAKYTLSEFINNFTNNGVKNAVALRFKATGLIVVTVGKKTEYLNSWYEDNLRNAKISDIVGNKNVYSKRTGDKNFEYTDSGYWDLNSFRALGASGQDFYVRPSDAIRPFGYITGKMRYSNGFTLIKIKVTHPEIFTNNGTNLANREIWVLGSRVGYTPYSPPVSGLLGTPTPQSTHSLNLA